MTWVPVMDRVGGYTDLEALELNARRYDELLIYMQAEREAAFILRKTKESPDEGG